MRTPFLLLSTLTLFAAEAHGGSPLPAETLEEAGKRLRQSSGELGEKINEFERRGNGQAGAPANCVVDYQKRVAPLMQEVRDALAQTSQEERVRVSDAVLALEGYRQLKIVPKLDALVRGQSDSFEKIRRPLAAVNGHAVKVLSTVGGAKVTTERARRQFANLPGLSVHQRRDCAHAYEQELRNVEQGLGYLAQQLDETKILLLREIDANAKFQDEMVRRARELVQKN